MISELATPGFFDLLRLRYRSRRSKLELIENLFREYGDFVRLKIGSRTFYLIASPALAHEVLVRKAHVTDKGVGLREARIALGEGLLTGSGDLWRRHRTEIQDLRSVTLRRTVMEHAYAGIIERTSTWRDDAPIDVYAELSGVTLNAVAKAILAPDAVFDAPAFLEQLRAVEAYVTASVGSVLPDRLRRFSPLRFRARRASATLRTLARAWGAEHTSFDANTAPQCRRPIGDQAQGKLLDADQRAEVVLTLLVAGHETVASALTWTLYLLARHPSVQGRLAEELDRAPLRATPEHIGNKIADSEFELTTNVINESLRLFPPVWIIPRQADRDIRLGTCTIPRGSDVLISPYLIHRHPAFWARPMDFLPDRFSEPSIRAEKTASYLPFGRGPQGCIGQTIALAEAKMIVAHIVRGFEVRYAGHGDPVPYLGLTMRPGSNFFLTFRRRQETGSVPI
jgi:cytochrome P450